MGDLPGDGVDHDDLLAHLPGIVDRCPGAAARHISCAFTGHRPHKFPWKDNEADPRCIALKETLAEQIAMLARAGVTEYFTGGAGGCVMYEEFTQDRIAQLRMQREVSARDMSLSLGQNNSYINQIENKKALPSLQGLFYICEYFGNPV